VYMLIIVHHVHRYLVSFDQGDFHSMSYTDMTASYHRMQDENQALRAAIQHEQKLRLASEHMCRDLEQKFVETKQGLVSTKEALVKVQAAADQMMGKRDQREAQIQKLQSMNKAYEGRILELEQKMTDESGVSPRDNAQIARFKKLLQDKEDDNRRLEQEVTEYSLEVNALKRENKRLNDEKKDAQYAVDAAEKKIMTMDMRFKSIDLRNQNRIEKLETELKELELATGQRSAPNEGTKRFESADESTIKSLLDSKFSALSEERKLMEARLKDMEETVKESTKMIKSGSSRFFSPLPIGGADHLMAMDASGMFQNGFPLLSPQVFIPPPTGSVPGSVSNKPNLSISVDEDFKSSVVGGSTPGSTKLDKKKKKVTIADGSKDDRGELKRQEAQAAELQSVKQQQQQQVTEIAAQKQLLEKQQKELSERQELEKQRVAEFEQQQKVVQQQQLAEIQKQKDLLKEQQMDLERRQREELQRQEDARLQFQEQQRQNEIVRQQQQYLLQQQQQQQYQLQEQQKQQQQQQGSVPAENSSSSLLPIGNTAVTSPSPTVGTPLGMASSSSSRIAAALSPAVALNPQVSGTFTGDKTGNAGDASSSSGLPPVSAKLLSKIEELKKEIATISSTNKELKGKINAFTQNFIASTGRKPDKEDRKNGAGPLFSEYHTVSKSTVACLPPKIWY
jgi:DNA repair exonuclease SbcCD ATPase subunit